MLVSHNFALSEEAIRCKFSAAIHLVSRKKDTAFLALDEYEAVSICMVCCL